MAINKRKLGSTGLQRRVRPRREDDWEMDHDAGQDSSSEDDEVEEQSTRRKRDDDDSEEDEDEGEDSEAGSGSAEDSEVSYLYQFYYSHVILTSPRTTTNPPHQK